MPSIKELRAWEILDSRGRPTVKAACHFESGAVGIASVPSGASSGRAEAHELRDGDALRYGGLGCRKAVGHVNNEIAKVLMGTAFIDQRALDNALLELDGTSNKSRLGANAILAVSLAFSRACAMEREQPLYQYYAALTSNNQIQLPRPTINLFSGGLHAGGQVPIQDVLVVPAAAQTIDEAMSMTYAVFQAAASLTKKRYDYRLLRADEGGLAPPFADADEMLAAAVEAIEAAGYKPGVEVSLAVDVAASHFYKEGGYVLDTEPISSKEMIDIVAGWVNDYPIVSVEDGLAEEDWDNWKILKQQINGKALVLGDDLLCTNPARIEKAISMNAADALLLKVNQIGSLTEAIEAFNKARAAGWKVTVSARSGETEDDWLADLAVGLSGNQIKVGSITQSERLAKYNRLLVIEAETGMKMESWPRG